MKTKTKGRSTRSNSLPRDAVNRESWLAFVDLHLGRSDDHLSHLTFDGWLVGDSDRRALDRWKKEGATPRLWKADAFLVRHGMLFRDFEIWCEHDGRDALAFPDLETAGAI